MTKKFKGFLRNLVVELDVNYKKLKAIERKVL